MPERFWLKWIPRGSKTAVRAKSATGSVTFTSDEFASVKAAAAKRGVVVQEGTVVALEPWTDWVFGDTDCDADLLTRLGLVAAELKTQLFVTFGRRTHAEQEYLYDQYLHHGGNLAARPGTSNHEKGLAADVVRKDARNVNLGDIPGARKALKKHGLCLPVPGESWHTEVGSVFNA